MSHDIARSFRAGDAGNVGSGEKTISAWMEMAPAPGSASRKLRSVAVKSAVRPADAPGADDPDILIWPDTSALKLLDFSAYEALAETGYRAAREALAHPDADRIRKAAGSWAGS
jgi:predicted acylesterase/phospholipase RssA